MRGCSCWCAAKQRLQLCTVIHTLWNLQQAEAVTRGHPQRGYGLHGHQHIIRAHIRRGGHAQGTGGCPHTVLQGINVLDTDLAGRLPTQASQLYGTNLVNLMKLLTPGKDGEMVLDFDDIVQRSVTIVRDGAETWPPPPVQVSAAPVAAAVEVVAREPKRAMGKGTKLALGVLGGAALIAIVAIAPAPLPQHFTVLALSIVIGFYVIGKVAHALHTPLMSVTNAISGIIVVGAMLQLSSSNLVVQILAGIAVLVASINIFGGFAVTRRMLRMFSKGDQR